MHKLFPWSLVAAFLVVSGCSGGDTAADVKPQPGPSGVAADGAPGTGAAKGDAGIPAGAGVNPPPP